MKLYIIPTPIGNLKDITIRGIETLKSVDFLVVEDKRITHKLLKRYDIQKPMVSYHSFNEHAQLGNIIEKIKTATSVAIVSDAGTPSLSDPGFLLIRECIKEHIDVEALPGPCAAITALVESGFPTESFIFEGFLPKKKGRKAKLESLKDEKRTMIFYESPQRIYKTILDFREVFGEERMVSIHREMTKIYAETTRKAIKKLLLDNPKTYKGEVVIIVEGKTKSV